MHDEADVLYRRSIDVTNAALGPGHPDLAARLNNWAMLLHEEVSVVARWADESAMLVAHSTS